MLLTQTHIEGERIAAIFPAISTDSDGSRIADCVVITIREGEKTAEPFSLHRLNSLGHSILGIIPTFPTFPAALRAARKSQGWG